MANYENKFISGSTKYVSTHYYLTFYRADFHYITLFMI